MTSDATAEALRDALEVSLGATILDDGRTRFRLWAPQAREVMVQILEPTNGSFPMTDGGKGYFEATVNVSTGALYTYLLDGALERPDPASRLQPQGVHGPSQVVSGDFDWHDGAWRAPELPDYIIYELHVGTFTPKGDFDAVASRLPYLRSLGVTAIELMPVAQFPGERNWGYDGVYPFAAQASYGGPEGLRRLVDACHREGLAVVLDVVYNHLGPEGNYLRDFGPYFTDAYKTPWGAALNFDGDGSDEVRRFFAESAVYWTREFHIDAFRLDAVHAIVDPTAYPFVEQLTDTIHAEAERLGKTVLVMAETSLNSPHLIQPKHAGGWGVDALWNDDFHHSVHTVLTGEHGGYYADFGHIEQLAKAIHEGFVYSGEFSQFRGRRHGRSSAGLAPERFVVAVQNHDQVGNRALGERLPRLLPFEALKLATGLLLLSPNVPLLFMGEEYAETAPFPYFVSHSDPELIEAVRLGRKAEFESFGRQGEIPDPQAESTFSSAVLHPELAESREHKAMLEYYRGLIDLRKRITPRKSELTHEVDLVNEAVLVLRRGPTEGGTVTVFNLSSIPREVSLSLGTGAWKKLIDSADEGWLGPGSEVPADVVGEVLEFRLEPYSVTLFAKDSAS